MRDVIISSVKSRVRLLTHEYGTRIPTSLEHDQQLDIKNENSFWRKAIDKETINVDIAFEVLETIKVSLTDGRQ